MSLKISISGVRGFVPETLTPEICLDFAKAFGTFLSESRKKSPVVVIGTDARKSSEFIRGIVFAGLLSTGCRVIDIGIAPTPTVGFMTRKLKADGGMIITASHNPLPWNGLKFIRHDGIFLNEKQALRLIEIYEKKAFIVRPPQNVTYNATAIDQHIKKVLAVLKPPRLNFKVVVDACNSAGSVAAGELLHQLGCKFIPLNCDTSKPFPHPPEPIAANLKALMQKVKAEHADIGFALDSDADRLAIVSNEGKAIGEELTLALAVRYMLEKSGKKNPQVVINLSTTQAIEDIVQEKGGTVLRTKIGEVHVAEALVRTKALIGGEGNGGVIFPPVTCNRDSLAGMVMILSLMAQTKKTIAELANAVPAYHMVKGKIDCGSQAEASALVEKIKKDFKQYTLVLTEGVKVLFPDGWLHVRASNTEPIIRVMAEGKDKAATERLVSQVLEAGR
ncbi:MAG: phosphoglucosamine mutase [Candidatus Margulisiibacteriota bacterium]